MKKTTKAWLIIAALLILIGCALFAGVMTMLEWDFAKLSTVKYETNTYEIHEAFERISFNTDTADIVFAPSDDGKCRVDCYESEDTKHSVTVENNMLVIDINPSSRHNHIGFNSGSPKITVYLPEAQYASLHIDESTGNVEIPSTFMFGNVDISSSTGDVSFHASASGRIKIKTRTGSIRVENISVGALDLSVNTGTVTVSNVGCEEDVTVGVSTGKTYLSNTQCKNVISSGSTGDISLDNVIAAESFSIIRSTGDVNLDNSDAAEIFVKTDTGDVTGRLLADKAFIVQADTGDVDVPQTAEGGRCEITTDTGDINITIAQS